MGHKLLVGAKSCEFSISWEAPKKEKLKPVKQFKIEVKAKDGTY